MIPSLNKTTYILPHCFLPGITTTYFLDRSYDPPSFYLSLYFLKKANSVPILAYVHKKMNQIESVPWEGVKGFFYFMGLNTSTELGK